MKRLESINAASEKVYETVEMMDKSNEEIMMIKKKSRCSIKEQRKGRKYGGNVVKDKNRIIFTNHKEELSHTTQRRWWNG